MKELNPLRRNIIALPLALWLLAGCATVTFTTADQRHNKYEINQEIAPDEKIATFVMPYKQQLEADMNQVIGHSETRLTKPGTQAETLLGNFFTDALLHEGRKLDPEIDFAFGTKGGLRIELPKGDITKGHIFELMPFENQLVILELTSEKVEQLANYIAASNGQPLSGMRMQIRNGKASNIIIGTRPLQKNKTYKLLTYDYLANGGDNSKGLDQPVNRIDFQQKVRETLIEHITALTRAGQSINTKLDGRVSNSQ